MIETHSWSVIVWPSSFFFLHFLKGQQHNHVAIVSKSSVYTIAAIFISSKSCNNHFINAFRHHSVSHPSLSLLAIQDLSLPPKQSTPIPHPHQRPLAAFPTPTQLLLLLTEIFFISYRTIQVSKIFPLFTFS